MSVKTRLSRLYELVTDQNEVYEARHRLLYRTAFWTGVFFFTLYAAFPIYWILATALKNPTEIYQKDQTLVPQILTLDNFQRVFEANFLQYMFNSLIISGGAVLTIIIVCSLAAYALARLDFAAQRWVMFGVLLVSMFPPVVFVVSMFRIMSDFGWINTHQGLIVPFIGLFSPMALWILKDFYEQIPDGLEKAARIDGCSRIGALFRVIMPLSAPGVASVAILIFIMTYNEFLFSFIMTKNIQAQPVSVGLYAFQQRFVTPWHIVSAASIVSIVPVIALVLVAQDRIVSGLTQGSLKE